MLAARGPLTTSVAGVMLAAVAAAVQPAPAAGDEPWWTPVGLRGQRVESLAVAATRMEADVGSTTLESLDSGRTFRAAAGPVVGACTRAGCQAHAPPLTWDIAGGRVRSRTPGHPPDPDPAGPDLGASAHLVAAPAALPGTVIAVSDAGVVWRRSPGGRWGRSLILLPRTLVTGTPAVTSVAAFDAPVSDTVYVGTDGYSVLTSGDGGDGWVRAGPGLPGGVLSLFADSASRSVYAGTDDGLWVHRLRRPPGPPAYSGGGLWLRWLGTAAIGAAAAGAAIAVMLAGVRPPGRRDPAAGPYLRSRGT